MSRTRLIRVATATLATTAVAVAVVTAVAASVGGNGGLAANSVFEYTVPAISILALVGVAWALTASAQSAGHKPGRVVRCESCGGPIFGEWRLCPHCGVRLDERTDKC